MSWEWVKRFSSVWECLCSLVIHGNRKMRLCCLRRREVLQAQPVCRSLHVRYRLGQSCLFPRARTARRTQTDSGYWSEKLVPVEQIVKSCDYHWSGAKQLTCPHLSHLCRCLKPPYVFLTSCPGGKFQDVVLMYQNQRGMGLGL